MPKDSESSWLSKLFVPVVVAVVAGIIIALFNGWFNADRYDLRFSLSERIPLKFGGAQDEAVQQIEINNLGKKEVNQIIVKLPAPLISYDVTGNSLADKWEINTNAQSAEFLYANLPPNSAFRIVFKTLGTGVTKTNVRVSHSKGVATNALDQGTSPATAAAYGYVTGLAFWLIIGCFSLRSLVIDHWDSKAGYDPEAVMRKVRPFYVSQTRWDEVRKKAARRLAYQIEGMPGFSESDNSGIYMWLNKEKPEYFSDEEWARLIATLTKSLHERIDSGIDRSWVTKEDILKTLRISKPKNVSHEQWEERQVRLQEAYLQKRANDWRTDQFNRLKEIKPDVIDDSKWSENQLKIGKNCAATLLQDAYYVSSPLTFVQQKPLECLPGTLAAEVLAKAYQYQLRLVPNVNIDDSAEAFLKGPQPSWMQKEDYEERRSIAERTIKNKKADVFNRIIKEIVLGLQPTESGLESLDEDSRKIIVKLDEEIRVAMEENHIASKKMKEESALLTKDRSLVLKQLSIIQNVFNDPTSIDRIEVYDNPFASGNVELLRKLSRGLQPSKSG